MSAPKKTPAGGSIGKVHARVSLSTDYINCRRRLITELVNLRRDEGRHIAESLYKSDRGLAHSVATALTELFRVTPQ